MTCIKGQFDVVDLMVNDQFKTFSINLNAQHVNGMTHSNLALRTVIRYSRVRCHSLGSKRIIVGISLFAKRLALLTLWKYQKGLPPPSL